MPEERVQVTLTKLDYDQFVYPSVSRLGPQGPEELGVGMRALDAIEDRTKAWREDLDPKVVEAYAREGKFLRPRFRQEAPEETWEFTEDVARYIAASLNRWAQSGNIALAACRHAQKLASRFLSANPADRPAEAVEVT